MKYKTTPFQYSKYPNMHEILPNLWLGDFDASINEEILIKNKINYIISVIGRDSHKVPVKNHLFLQLLDGDVFQPKQLESGINFIIEAIEGKNEGVLVHCMAGISRSSTLISAFLMKIKGFNPNKAINYLKERREIVDPAFNTFNSAIAWAYPNKKAFCRICKLPWEYIEDYDMFQTRISRSVITCHCELPDVFMQSIS